MIFYGSIQPKGERTEKDGDGIHQPQIQVLLSLTCFMSLNPKVYQLTTISNHIQPYPTISNHIQSHHSSTKSLSEALASSSHRHSWVPPCEVSVDAQDRRRGCRHLSHCHDQSNTPSIFSMCIHVWILCMYIRIYKYIYIYYIIYIHIYAYIHSYIYYVWYHILSY